MNETKVMLMYPHGDFMLAHSNSSRESLSLPPDHWPPQGDEVSHKSSPYFSAYAPLQTTSSRGAEPGSSCEATTLYSDYPLSKEQRRKEDREQPSLQIVGPLPHQCAGHETVFRTTDGKICKPLDETEFWFYKVCLREFPHYKPFVPQWHGCVLLSRKKLLRLIDSLGDEDSSSSDDEPTLRDRPGSFGPSSPGSWSLLLSEEFRLKLELEENTSKAPSSRGQRFYPYIVLEDLTAGFFFPCTLDIKMGTKDLHHQFTTSTTLGLRIMGMQVYEPDARAYRQFDKMQGRKLVNETVPHQLVQFLTQSVNGKSTFRRDVLKVFIEKLKLLLSTLCQDDSIQIQNSSILLVYEGRPAFSKADVRMIDFQHVQLTGAKTNLRSPTVLSPPLRRRIDSPSSGDDDTSIGDDSEDILALGVRSFSPQSDDGLVWGFSNLIALLETALDRAG